MLTPAHGRTYQITQSHNTAEHVLEHFNIILPPRPRCTKFSPISKEQARHLKMGPIGCTETTVTISNERMPHLLFDYRKQYSVKGLRSEHLFSLLLKGAVNGDDTVPAAFPQKVWATFWTHACSQKRHLWHTLKSSLSVGTPDTTA
jgi:hypothetical protein